MKSRRSSPSAGAVLRTPVVVALARAVVRLAPAWAVVVVLAGSIPAIRRARGRVATVAVNSFVFKQPVFVGDIVSLYADIIKVGHTSITVDVSVYAQRGVREGGDEICIRVTEAVLTYVAIDNNRRPKVVPQE